MVVVHIINVEIINNEYKNNGAPLVAPKPWRSGGFIVSIIVKERAEKVKSLASLTAWGSPYHSFIISNYIHSLFSYGVILYSSINSCGMFSRRIRKKYGRSIGVAR